MTDVLDTARLRMRNSGLGGAFRAPIEVVSWHLAMQAQDYGPAKWAIAQRAAGVGDADIERALSDGDIVRTHVLRPTWHFVCADDLRWLLALTGPRIQQGNAGRYRELGLDADVRARARKSIGGALRGGERMTRNQIGEVLERSGIDPSGQRLPHLLMDCELEAVICSGERVGKHHSYALADERLPEPRPFDRDEALVELVRRYLSSHGPATVHDMSWWSGLTITDIRRGLSDLGGDVTARTIDGTELWSVNATPASSGASMQGAHLLQTYDELIVGYTKSRYFGDPRQESARAAWKDRSLPTGIVLLDAAVAGHWRRTTGRGKVSVDVLLYDATSRRDRSAVESAARDLADVLGLDLELRIGRV